MKQRQRLFTWANAIVLLLAWGCADLMVYNPHSGLFVKSGGAIQPLVISPEELPAVSVVSTGTLDGDLRILMTSGEVAAVGNRTVEAVPVSAAMDRVRANILKQSEDPDYGRWFKPRASQVLESWVSAYPRRLRARAVTNGTGHFNLVVPAGQWFVISYIDFRPRTDFAPGTPSSGQVLWMEPVTIRPQDVTTVELSERNAVFVK